MLCLIFNIHNPLNYDVGFPDLGIDELPIKGVVSHKTTNYSVYNKDTYTIEDPVAINLYKVRLSGIIKRKQEMDHQAILSDGEVKHKLIQWNNRTGGVFYINIKSLDNYGRIEAEFFDPVTGESLMEWMLNAYPTIYRRYVTL